jgi:hypothetical protein
MNSSAVFGQQSATPARPAFLAANSEMAIALVVFAILLRIAISELRVSAAAAIFGPVPAPAPLIVPLTLMAIAAAAQLAVAFALRAREEQIHRVGIFGAGTLALIWGLITATLVATVGMLLAAFVIDSAQSLAPADLNEILAELGMAQYVSAQGIAAAIPITGWLALLNARSAFSALGEIGEHRGVTPPLREQEVPGG